MKLESGLWLAGLVSSVFTMHAALAQFDSAAAPAGALRVARVTPEGQNVPAGSRQIVVTFDRAVTPLGRMTVAGSPAPITVTPDSNCQWHWLDPRSLACELNAAQALSPATRYTVVVGRGLHALDQTELGSSFTWTFDTERPAIKEYSFYSWRSPGTPVVRLVFNQPVTQDSLQAQLHFVSRQQPQAALASAEISAMPGRVWLVSPSNELPANARVRLTVDPGLRGSAGALAGMERRTVVEFDTFPGFRFLGVRCSVGTQNILLLQLADGQQQPGCNPFGSVSLAFSSPVVETELKAHLHLSPDLAAGRTDIDPWANAYPRSRLTQPHRRGAEYTVDLPEHLRAFQSYAIDGLRAVRDEFGRPLVGPDSMVFRTDHRPPRLKVTHPIAVLEKNVPTAMPIYVTNLTDIDIHFRSLTTGGSNRGSTNQLIDRAWDISYATPAKVRELLAGQSGVVSGAFAPHPTPPASDADYADSDEDSGLPQGHPDRDFFVEVTPFQVHVKLGHYNTLVWVTSLAKGLPVPNARVRIFKDNYRGLTAEAGALAESSTGADGVAMLPGRPTLDQNGAADTGSASKTLMVRVDSEDDMALLPLDGSFEVDTYRASRGKFWSSFSSERDHMRAWGTTAQGVYKLGDTVQYKFYLRNQNNLTLEPVAQRDGFRLDIVDPTGKIIKTEAPISLSQFGAYAGSVRLPPSGSVGWYEFRLSQFAPRKSAGAAEAEAWTPMRVLAADFTPAPFQVQNSLNGQLFEPGDRVEVHTQASLHAGGPYADAASRVTARLFPQPVETGNAAAAGFEFASVEPRGECSWSRGADELTVHQSAGRLDAQGKAAASFQLPDADMPSARLEVESAVRDDRGKYVASRSVAEYRGRDRFVGLHSDHWTFEAGKPATIEYLVIDKNGQPASGIPVTVSAKTETVRAARVKGAGDAYLTSFQSQWIEEASCAGASAARAQNCTFTPSRPGLYSVVARIRDTGGREHATEMCVWVTGKGQVLWQEPADMSLSLEPEKTSYKVGEHARYLVRNPFPGARALITIERYGVVKRWVQTLQGSTPLIDFVVEPDYMPGFYLSVMVVSPRVAPAPVTDAGVDLGRPTYRIGYVKVPVQDPYKTLDVRVHTDRSSYKPRERVKIELAASPHEPQMQRQPIEFAVTVLDEAVFDLIQDGKNYFDPYHGLYRFDDLDLVNYSLLSRLVGLQKFEKKGANSGGDGGAGFDMRNVTQYVAYWNPAVRADEHGHASVSFDLPDNLTGWHVFAMAVTPGDRVGLGEVKFKSSKLTELRPVMPNQLEAGDRFTAGFSVLNRSDKTRTLQVSIKPQGPALDMAGIRRLITLAPFARDTVWLPIETSGDGRLSLAAEAGDMLDNDRLVHKIEIHKRGSLEVAASYGTTESDGVDVPLQFPADMTPGVGELSLTLAPTVIGNVEGALRYVKSYPYDCWEQRLSKALMALSYRQLRPYLSSDLDWPEAQMLPQTLLDDAAGFQAPNGGMGFWSGEDERVSPYLSAATALGFNRLRAAGYRVPENVQKNLDAYLNRLLRDNNAPSFYSDGMVSSVRAVALLSLAQRQELKLADLQRYEPYATRMDLFGLAAFLDAAVQVKGAERLSAGLVGQILAHANQSGGQFHFSEPWDDGYSQMLATPMRSECAILTAFLHYGLAGAGSARVGDIPFKLVRNITQSRAGRDHWENTQENLYCTAALAEYAAIYEKKSPALAVHATLERIALGAADFKSLKDPPVALTRANSATDVGRAANLHIDRSGDGRLYYAARLSFTSAETAGERNAGVEIHREYSVQRDGRWQLLNSPVSVKRGELVRVDLYVSLAAPRHFLVVDDPVPGGLEPVNRELATASTVDADSSDFSAAGGAFWFKYSDWSEYGITSWNFYHRELRHQAARFYADYLPAGHYHLSYGAQVIAEGRFRAAASRAEEMYDPDVFGTGLPAEFVVRNE